MKFDNARLKQLRLKKGLAQQQVAERVGLSLTAYRNYESGRVNRGGSYAIQKAVTFEMLQALAQFFGLEGPDAFFCDDTSPVDEAPEPSRPVARRIDLRLGELPGCGSPFIGRELELDWLDDAARQGLTAVSIIGIGGEGKTALLDAWLARLADRAFDDFEAVYVWSFHGQEADAGRQASADYFLLSLTEMLGLTDVTKRTAMECGRYIATHLQKHRCLLLLDGFETLLRIVPDEPGSGQVTDVAMASLLKQLVLSSAGLTLISSRLKIRDLNPFVGGRARSLDLEPLSAEAGSRLLRNYGLLGSSAELEQTVASWNGHALGLTLLARALPRVTGSRQVSRHREMLALREGPHTDGASFQILMTYYERLLEATDASALRVMELICMLDPDLGPDGLDAVLSHPPIPGLTDDLTAARWRWHRAIEDLRETGLLRSSVEPRSRLPGCHPLIRASFMRRLEARDPVAWRAVHRRLFEFSATAVPGAPETPEQVRLLFAGLKHALQAGCYVEAVQLAQRQLAQGRELFEVARFGTLSACIECLSFAFDEPWRRVAADVPSFMHPWLYSWAGHALYSTGRQREAREALERAWEYYISSGVDEDIYHGLIVSICLADCLLVLGRVDRLRILVAQLKSWTDGLDSDFVVGMVTAFVVTHVDAMLAQAEGAASRALALFEQTHRLWKLLLSGDEPRDNTFFSRFPFICFQHAFFYGALLVDSGRYADAEVLVDQVERLPWFTEWTHEVREVTLMPRYCAQIAARVVSLGPTHPRTRAPLEAARAGLDRLRRSDFGLPLVRSLLNTARLHIMLGTDADLEAASGLLNEVSPMVDAEGLRFYQLQEALLRCRVAHWTVASGRVDHESTGRDPVVYWIEAARGVIRETGLQGWRIHEQDLATVLDVSDARPGPLHRPPVVTPLLH